MILTGPEIQRQVELGKIQISPFRPEQVNPASYDLRLGREILVYEPELFVEVDGKCIFEGPELKTMRGLDAKTENRTRKHVIANEGIWLCPGTLYLMHTAEVVGTREFVTVIDGKSSIGRLGIVCHLTAGYGDPGFFGQYTLEVSVVHPVRVYAGMRFCQARFQTVQGDLAQYDGNYAKDSHGPVASRSWKQFNKK